MPASNNFRVKCQTRVNDIASDRRKSLTVIARDDSMKPALHHCLPGRFQSEMLVESG